MSRKNKTAAVESIPAVADVKALVIPKKDLMTGEIGKPCTHGYAYHKKAGRAKGLEGQALHDYVKEQLTVQRVLGVSIAQDLAKGGAALVRAAQSENKFGDVRTALTFVKRAERPEKPSRASAKEKIARLEADLKAAQEQLANISARKADVVDDAALLVS